MSLESETVRTLEDYQCAFDEAVAHNDPDGASLVLRNMRKRGFNDYAKVLVSKTRLANLKVPMTPIREDNWPTQEQNG